MPIPSQFFLNLHLLFNFDEMLYGKSLFECWLKIKTKCKKIANVNRWLDLQFHMLALMNKCALNRC